MSGDGTGSDGGDRGLPLDPGEDPAAWERRVEAITDAAEPELDRRSRELAPAFGLQLEQWARPVLTAAAGLIMAGTAVLVLYGQPRAGGGSGPATASAGGSDGTLVSPVVDPWLEGDTLTIDALEELVTVSSPPGGLP